MHRECLIEAHKQDREKGLTCDQIEDVKVFISLCKQRILLHLVCLCLSYCTSLHAVTVIILLQTLRTSLRTLKISFASGEPLANLSCLIQGGLQCCVLSSHHFLAMDRVAAAACVYFRRFYLKENFCDYDPRLVGPACLFLACKAEESQVQAKVLFQMLRKVSSTGVD